MSAGSPALQTPLTQAFPATASMSRQELERLLAGWDPYRGDVTWYNAKNGQANEAGQRGKAIVPPEEEAFEAFVESLPEVKALRQESQQLLALSEEKASRNTSMQPALEQLRRETQQLYDRARSLEQRWPIVEREMGEESKRFSPGTLLFMLTQSASKLHDESESLASAFVEGLPLEVASTHAALARGLTPPDSGTATPTGRDADGDATFVRRYRALRSTYHRRNLIADRWTKGLVTWRDD